MSAPISEDDLHAYVDQQLDEARAAQVRDYLHQHPEVMARVSGYQRQRDALRDTLRPLAEEPVPSHLSLRHLLENQPAKPEARHFKHSFPWQAAAALAFMLLGGIGGWSLRGVSPTPAATAVAVNLKEGIDALAHEANSTYSVYAADPLRPVELTGQDKQTFVDWASQRLGAPLQIPTLASAGFSFMGGRIVATEHGPGVMLMYTNDQGARLVMLTRAMKADKNAPMKEYRNLAANSFTWAVNGMGYSLVGALQPDLLHPLADDIRQQLRVL